MEKRHNAVVMVSKVLSLVVIPLACFLDVNSVFGAKIMKKTDFCIILHPEIAKCT